MGGLSRILGVSTRVVSLSCLSVVVLVILQASSAPVDTQTMEKSVRTPSSGAEELNLKLDKFKRSFSNFTCSACKYAVRLIQDMFDSKMSFNAIADVAGEICYLAKIQDKNVCKGITQTFKVCKIE